MTQLGLQVQTSFAGHGGGFLLGVTYGCYILKVRTPLTFGFARACGLWPGTRKRGAVRRLRTPVCSLRAVTMTVR